MFVTIPTLDRYKSADRSIATPTTVATRRRFRQAPCANRHCPQRPQKMGAAQGRRGAEYSCSGRPVLP